MLVIVTGCAATPADQASSEKPSARQSTAQMGASDKTMPAVEIPAADFPPEILYQLLVAEIAAQRGQLGIAIANYLAAANTSRDVGIAKRATHLAIFAQVREAALEAAELWIELEPENSEPYQIVAPLLLGSGSIAESVSFYKRLIEINADDPDRVFKLIGSQLARERDPQAALSVMEQLIATRPDEPYAHLAQAHVAARHSELDLALASVDQAMALRPNWSDAVVMRANILSLKGDKAAAIETLADAYKDKLASDSNIGLNLAKMLAESGDMARAREIFESIAKQQPDNADVRYAAGILALQFNDLEQAETHLQRVLELGKRRQEATYHLGLVYEQQGRVRDAIKLYSAVLISEYYLEAQMRVANLLAKEGELDDALAHLQQVRVNNEDEQVRLYLLEGELLGKAGRQQAALDFFTKKLMELPENSSLRYSRALMAEKLNNIALAEEDLLYIISRDPSDAQALNALGYTLADRTERLEEAFDYISRALEIEPNDAVIMDSMGWVQYRMGNYTEALALLRRALGLLDDPEIAAHLGEVLWVMDKKQEALEVWDKALEKNPNHSALLKVMKRFGL